MRKRIQVFVLVMMFLLSAGSAMGTTMTRGSLSHWSVYHLKSQYEYRYNVLKDGAIAASRGHVLALREDGTVLAAGDNSYGQCEVSSWTDIVAVSAGTNLSIGLRADGTVRAAGDNSLGQCGVDDWTDIVAVCAGWLNSVGLRAEGTVVVAGDSGLNQYAATEWENIVAISMTRYQIFGLKVDGTVVCTGVSDELFYSYDPGEPPYYFSWDSTYLFWGSSDLNAYDGFEEEYEWNRWIRKETSGTEDLYHWDHIVAIACGGSHVLGLRDDGIVLTAGESAMSQGDIDDWKDVTAIAAGDMTSLGWSADGNVLATYVDPHVDQQQDFIAITYYAAHYIGLKTDGSIVIGMDEFYEPTLEDVAEEISQWRNIGRNDWKFTFEGGR